MDEQDLDFDLDDHGEDPDGEVDIERFYWALKAALARTPAEPPPPGA